MAFGDDAPDFILYDQEGFPHTLKEHRGKFVLLYFYARDFSVECAKKIKTLANVYPKLYKNQIVVYGISPDNVDRHRKFHTQFHLAFDLLSDPDEGVMKAYGAKGVFFPKQRIYIVGPDGRVFRIYDNMAQILSTVDLILTTLNQ